MALMEVGVSVTYVPLGNLCCLILSRVLRGKSLATIGSRLGTWIAPTSWPSCDGQGKVGVTMRL